MRIVKQQSRIRTPSQFEVYCLLVACGGIYYILTAMPKLSSGQPREPLGFIGPFKGGTRAVASLIQGRVFEAVTFNPLAILFVFVVAMGGTHFLLLSLLLRRRFEFNLNRVNNLMLAFAATLALVCGWAYVLLGKPYMNLYGG